MISDHFLHNRRNSASACGARTDGDGNQTLSMRTGCGSHCCGMPATFHRSRRKKGKWVFSRAQKRARSFPLLLYHLLSTRTLPFWTIFLGVLSPILRRKRLQSGAPAVRASPLSKRTSCVCSKRTCFIRRVPDPRRVRK